MGIVDWGLGDWRLGPIPNPQSPIPNPQSPFSLIFISLNELKNKIFNNYIISKILKYFIAAK